MTETLVVYLPTPDRVLDKNGRGWTATGKRRDGSHYYVSERSMHYKARREDARRTIAATLATRRAGSGPFVERDQRCYLTIDWFGPKGHWPDDDNVIERCAAYRDGAQDAGLVVNDRQIVTRGVRFHVATRFQRCIVLTFAAHDVDVDEPEVPDANW